ncbi:MAG: hypothetical protein LBH08_04000 [Puniceicoccales bacterium]|jgi:hypothetical protein|nr:hypothetical protein [Puniceicoccales bacterium]
MSEIKINTNDTNTGATRAELLQMGFKEQPDVRDIGNFQAFLNKQEEDGQKKDFKRSSKDDKANLKESEGNISIFALLLGEKMESKKAKAASDRKEEKVNTEVDADEAAAKAEVNMNKTNLIVEKFETMSKEEKGVSMKTETASERGNVKVKAAVDVKVDTNEVAVVVEKKAVESEKPITVNGMSVNISPDKKTLNMLEQSNEEKMSEIRISVNDTNTRTARVESSQVEIKEKIDIRDTNHFQVFLSKQKEGGQEKDSKRNLKKNEADLKESGENISIFTLFLGEKTESKKAEVAPKRKDIRVESEANANTTSLAVEEEFGAAPGAMPKKMENVSVKVEAGSKQQEEFGAAPGAMPKKMENVSVKVEAGSKREEEKVEPEANANATSLTAEKEFGVAPGAMPKKMENVSVKVEAGSKREEEKVDSSKEAVVVEEKAVESESIGAPMAVNEGSVNNNTPGEGILSTQGQISASPSIISTSRSMTHAGMILKIGREVAEYLAINNAKQEVVVRFKENVLPDTQVSIVREGTKLNLIFVTGNTQSKEILNAGCNELQTFLIEQLKDIKEVHIRTEKREFSDLSEKNPQKRQQNQQSEKESDENTY